MICPFCFVDDDKVIDSRSTEGGHVVRRRRQCQACNKRFTTYERVEQASRLMVVKNDGSRVPFDADKVLAGVSAACGKRPVSADTKRKLVDEVEEEIHGEFEREVPSHIIGERVMSRLRHIDAISYIRFATEHLQMAGAEEVRKELDDLMNRPLEGPDQQPLFQKDAPAG